MAAQKTSQDSIVLALVDKYFPDSISYQEVGESVEINEPPIPHAAAAAYVFDVLEALDREQIIRALEQERRTIDKGRAEIVSMVERRATSHDISALCLGLGKLLWNVGDLRCVAFGLRNTSMARDLQPGALNDVHIRAFDRMLEQYREVVGRVLDENVKSAHLAGRPDEYLPLAPRQE
jgi:hypothetical protein